MSELQRPFPPNLKDEVNISTVGGYDVVQVDRIRKLGMLEDVTEVQAASSNDSRIAYWIGNIINGVRPIIVVVYPPRADHFTWYCGAAAEPAPQDPTERDNYYLDSATSVVHTAYEAADVLPDFLETYRCAPNTESSHPDERPVEDVVMSL